eukprot:jgi/Picre1/28852/NNA_004249.t1
MGIFSGFGASKRGKDKRLKQVQGPNSIDDPLDTELPNPSLVREMSSKEASKEDSQGSRGQEIVENFEYPRIMPPEDRRDAVDGSPNVSIKVYVTVPRSKIPDLGCTLVELFEHFKAFEASALICHGQHENMSALVEFLGRCLEEYGCTDPLKRLSNTEEQSIHREIESIISTLQNLTGIAVSYSQPGWVYRLCIDTGLHEGLVNGASALAKSFQVLGLESAKVPILQNTHRLVVAELRSIGSGSWTAGLRAIRKDPGSLARLAKILRSSETVLTRESYLNQNLHGRSSRLATTAEKKNARQCFWSTVPQGGSSLLSAQGFQRYIIDSNHLDKLDDEVKILHACTQLFVDIDRDFDGYLSPEEFQDFYLQKRVPAIRSLVRLVTSISVERSIRDTFEAFAAFGSSGRSSKHHDMHSKHFLDGFRFSKLCKDSNIITSRENQKEHAILHFPKWSLQVQKRWILITFWWQSHA